MIPKSEEDHINTIKLDPFKITEIPLEELTKPMIFCAIDKNIEIIKVLQPSLLTPDVCKYALNKNNNVKHWLTPELLNF